MFVNQQIGAPMACKYVTYLRVSTDKQGASGLGLESQRATVQSFAQSHGCQIVGEFVEVESGRKAQRPQLALAIVKARISGATLLIARLDRLTRSVSLLEKLRDEKEDFKSCDMPDANEMTITIMAALAKQEADNISRNTKAAMAAAKKRPADTRPTFGNPMGAKAFGAAGATAYQLGVARNKAIALEHASRLAATVVDIKAQGIVTLSGIAAALNERNIVTTLNERKSGRGRWHASSVSNLLSRLT